MSGFGNALLNPGTIGGPSRFIVNPAREIIDLPDPDIVTNRLLGSLGGGAGATPTAAPAPIAPVAAGQQSLIDVPTPQRDTRGLEVSRRRGRSRSLISLEDTTTSAPRIIGR